MRDQQLVKGLAEKLKGKKVVLTGGAGFIGHHLAIRLKELGAETHVIDGLQVNHLGYYTSGYSTNPDGERFIAFLNERLSLLRQKRIQLHISDLRDYHVTAKIIDEIEPDTIVHFAAVAHANRSNKDPFSTFDHSMRTLENVLDAARTGRTHVIYLSSSMVYGNFGSEVVSEDKACNPLGIYGALKYGSEKLVIGYNQVFDIPYTIIRPSALYGKRCVSRRVVQAFIESALIGKHLSISGDGSDALDFTYVDDLVQGLVLAIVKPEAQGETFNVTFGDAKTLNHLADLICEEFPAISIKRETRDELMPERGTLSIEKIRNLLGYEPKFSLETGLREYIAWYREFAEENRELFQ
jgi:nucleoside-diphosphate-sugar epimerase